MESSFAGPGGHCLWIAAGSGSPRKPRVTKSRISRRPRRPPTAGAPGPTTPPGFSPNNPTVRCSTGRTSATSSIASGAGSDRLRTLKTVTTRTRYAGWGISPVAWDGSSAGITRRSRSSAIPKPISWPSERTAIPGYRRASRSLSSSSQRTPGHLQIRERV